MPLSVRTAEYYYTRIEAKPEQAYELLAKLASAEVNLLAFSAVPYGTRNIELTIFPDKREGLIRAAGELGWTLTGPQHAILIQGDDQLGAIADLHRRLLDENVSIYASTGVTDGQGHYGYVIYVKEADVPTAARALNAVLVTT